MNQKLFGQYKGDESYKAIADLYELINEKVFTTRDVGNISYRNLNHWEASGLLLEKKEEENVWHKFSFVELIWIKFCQAQRDFGLSMNVIIRTRMQLMQQFSTLQVDNLAVFTMNQKIKKQMEEGTTIIEEKIKKEFPDASDVELKRRMNKITARMTLLQFSIIEFITTRNHLSILIDKDAIIHVWNEHKNQYLLEKGFDAKYRNHISISLSEILKEFILNDKEGDNYPRLGIITEQENEVLTLLKKKELKTLTLRIKDQKIILIEATESYNTVDVASKFVEHILKNAYQDITFSTQNGKIVKFEKTTKYKITN